ncbi:MAG: MFS transporter [Helicobacteraceae bacterium]|nr:MFS transporter [Helicobacteraceae bacterium]
MFKKVLPLSAILSLRFLGLFLVLPLLSVYALTLDGATPLIVGVIVGGYALTQAIFQIPFGSLSDRIGRKPTLLFGLIIFIIGSLICAISTDIYMLMFGRFLQGAGAIGSVITAMISDLVEEKIRAKAMAIMGGTIALSFALAMGFGPFLGSEYGVNTLFYIAAGLGVFSIILLFTKVPTPPRITHKYNNKTTTKEILSDKNLLFLCFTGALQKGLMSATFVAIPMILLHTYEMPTSQMWTVYLPAMVLGLIAMGPAAVIGEKKNNPKLIFTLSIIFFITAFVLFAISTTTTIFTIAVVSFFIGFNMMEPLLQSMISKFAKVHQKGKALGIANTFAYVGTFIGATLAGVLLGDGNKETLGITFGVISVIWLLWTLKMSNPTRHSHVYAPIADVDQAKLDALESEFIKEWYINENEQLVIIKYESENISEEEVLAKI